MLHPRDQLLGVPLALIEPVLWSDRLNSYFAFVVIAGGSLALIGPVSFQDQQVEPKASPSTHFLGTGTISTDNTSVLDLAG